MLASLSWFPRLAHAQTTIALDRFQPTAPGDVFAVTEDPVAPDLDWFWAAQLLTAYAHNPLEVIELGTTRYRPVIDSRLWFAAQGQLAVAGFAQFDLVLPFVALNQGTAVEGDQGQYPAPSGAAPGDVRLGLRVVALRQQGAWPAIGLNGRLWLPSGSPSAYTSTGEPRYAASIAIGGDYESFSYRVSGGRRRLYLYEETDFKLGSDTVIRAAAGPRFGSLIVGPELLLGVASNEPEHIAETSVGNLEALLTANLTFGRWALRGGFGGALAQRQGTADFRAFLGVTFNSQAWERVPPKPVPVPAPKPSRESAQRVIDATRTRVALDQRLAATVKMPEQGPADLGHAPCSSEAPRSSDCLPDRDGDGIPDAEDRCPDEAGHASPGSPRHGCVRQALITSTHIELSGRIQFDTGLSTLLEASDEILTAIATVLEENPQIVRVAVEGHTDDVGVEADNLRLSRERALEVARWLVEHGVDERRLEVHGYGPRRPKADNSTPEGRAENRRVEFSIVRRDPRGKDAWTDGPIERQQENAPAADSEAP